MRVKFNLIIAIIFLAAVQIKCNAIEDKKPKDEIVKYKFRQLENNGYHFVYETSGGQSRDEFASFDNEKGILRITGYYSYIGDDKKLHTVKYTADENGYEATTEIEDIEDQTTPPSVELSAAAIAALAG